MLDGQAGLAIVTSVDGPSVVGQHFQIQEMKPNGMPFLPGEVAYIDWTISGALDGRTLDTTGFHDDDFGVGGTKTSIGDTVEGYWDGTTGTHTITAVVHYTQPTWMDYTIPVRWPDTYYSTTQVVAPEAGVQFTPRNRAGVYPADPNSGYTELLMASAYYTVKVDGTYGGSFGVVQTAQTQSSQLIDDLLGGKEMITTKTQLDGTPFTFLDNSPKIDPTSPYYGTFPNDNPPNTLTIEAGNSLPLKDMPNMKLDEWTLKADRADAFLDTVVYTPQGGIPVSVGSFRWAWSASTETTVSGQLGFGPKRTDIVADNPTPDNSLAGFKPLTPPTGQNPTWDMTAAEWKKSGFVRTDVYRSIPTPPELLDSPNYTLEPFPIPAGLAPMTGEEHNPYPTPEELRASADNQPMWTQYGADAWEDPYPSRDPYAIG